MDRWHRITGATVEAVMKKAKPLPMHPESLSQRLPSPQMMRADTVRLLRRAHRPELAREHVTCGSPLCRLHAEQPPST